MKEVRIKIEDDIYQRVSQEAAKEGKYIANKLKEYLVFDDKKSKADGKAVVTLRGLSEYKLKYLEDMAKKDSKSFEQTVEFLLDKALPSATMKTVMITVPRNLTGNSLKEHIVRKLK